MIKLCGLALLAAAATVVLNGVNSAVSKLIPAGAAVILLISAAVDVSPVVSGLLDKLPSAELSPYVTTLLRALGIAYVTELTSDVCRTCGADSAALGISFAGRAELTVIAAAFLYELLSLSLSLF